MATAGVVAAAVQAVGRFFGDHVSQWDWIPNWLAASALWVSKPPPPGVNYQAVVTAALTVTGTLAGVYFATVAFVVSTTYRDATARVRALVTRVPQGRVYTWVYVQAVLYALVVLIWPLSGHDPNRLSLAVLALAGALAVTSFGRLRNQLYALLEPAGLLRVVRRDLTRWATYAHTGSQRQRQWRLAVGRDNVRSSIITLRELCHLIRTREATPTDASTDYASVDPRILTTLVTVTGIWLEYADRKQRLVGEAGWSVPRDRHKDWLLTSDHEIGVALGTSTSLLPEQVDDPLWVERLLSATLSDLLGGRPAPELATLIGQQDLVERILMGRGQFEETQLWAEVVTDPARDRVLAETPANDHEPTTPSLTSTRSGEQAHLHNLVDAVGLASTDTVLGLRDHAAAMAYHFPSWTVGQAQGKWPRQPARTTSQLFRNIADGLDFERAVEGQRITSDANIHQLAARTISTELADELERLVTHLEDVVNPWVIALAATSSAPGAAALRRFDETLHKAIDVLLPAVQQCFDACEAVHRDVDDTWPDLATQPLRDRLATLSQALRLSIATYASAGQLEPDPDQPDAFGWAFYRAHDDLLDNVLDPQPDTDPDIGERFRHLVSATDRARARLAKSVRRTHYRVGNSFRMEPLLLLLQLSGIAYASAALTERATAWDEVARVWRSLLGDNAQTILDLALLAIDADDALIGLSAGKMNRSGRAQRAMHVLDIDRFPRSRRASRQGRTSGAGDQQAGQVARDRLVRALSAGVDFEDVFVAAWLMPEAIARGAEANDDFIRHPRLRDLISDFAPPAPAEDTPPEEPQEE